MARLDLPAPEIPVKQTNCPSTRSSETSLRLWVRAPTRWVACMGACVAVDRPPRKSTCLSFGGEVWAARVLRSGQEN